MFDDRLQHWLNTVRDTAPQRWALGSAGVLAIIVALAATLIGSGQRFGLFGVVIVATAAIAAIQAGSNTALLTISLAAVQWLSAADHVTTARSFVVAICLFVFHSTLALMAVTPHTAEIHPETLRRWARRGALVTAATLGVWLLAFWFERREAQANPLLTVFALAALCAAVVLVRRRSVDRSTV